MGDPIAMCQYPIAIGILTHFYQIWFLNFKLNWPLTETLLNFFFIPFLIIWEILLRFFFFFFF